MQVKESSRRKGRANASVTMKKGSSRLPSGKDNNSKEKAGTVSLDLNTTSNSKRKKVQESPKISSLTKKVNTEKNVCKKAEKTCPKKRKATTSDNMGIVCEEAIKNMLASPSRKLKKGRAQKSSSEDLKENIRSPRRSNSSMKKDTDNVEPHSIGLISNERNSVDVLEEDSDPYNGDETEDTTEDEQEAEAQSAENNMEIDTDTENDANSEKKDPAEEHISVLQSYQLDKSGKPKRFKCDICGKCASAKSDLIKHVRIHTGDRPYKCKICNASFIQITAFHGHVTIHTGDKPFKCDVCNKCFALKDRLRLHMRVHTGEKPHKCNNCSQTFARRSQVTQHQRVHTGQKAYQCTECNTRFASYHTLKGHMMAHRGVKEFQCGACGKKFIRVEGMYKHIRTVHRGSRPYTCHICGKAFKGHLRQHMRLHLGMRPYHCSTCGATFTQNSQLTVHMRIHTGERPYKCQICGAAFAHSSACKIHMRSHTGEKPFSCILCSSSFAQLPHLKKHMKCVHNAAKPYICKLCHNYFQTQIELEDHTRKDHGIEKTAEEEAEEIVEEATLARLRNRLAVLLYRISSEERRCKFGFGSTLVDDVLKMSLQSSGHEPVDDPTMSRLDELRKNVLLLLQWTIPKDTMEEYHKNNMTVDEVLDMLTT